MSAPDVACRLPDIPTLRARCRAVAAAEAMVNPSGRYTYYAYETGWGGAGEDVLLVVNGSGDDAAVVFSPAGVYIRVFDHESWMSPYTTDDEEPWPGVLDSVPDVFRRYVDEPAFNDEHIPLVTACIWRETGDSRWHTGDITFPEGEPDGDGAAWLLRLLVDGTPEAFRDWAQEYYERPVDLAAVREVFATHTATHT
ncbi:hypothetical protein [Streptomyces sp. NPDC050145]|uniref:hypothetical protein n=1 Tax=Streptomyces sp. NPDC050145 TaxID=3365602 RepID=UPI0037AA7C7A